MVGPRRKGRTLAFHALFEGDCLRQNPQGVLDRLLQEASVLDEAAAFVQKMGSEELTSKLEREARQWREAELFARELVQGFSQHREKIDQTLGRCAPEWPLEQTAPTDRNILRIAILELLFFESKVPPKAAIDEAVELAKIYGSESSPRFVNGVLGSVVRLVNLTA